MDYLITKANPYQITPENYCQQRKSSCIALAAQAGWDMPSGYRPQALFAFRHHSTLPFNGKYLVFHTSANTDDRCWSSCRLESTYRICA